MILDGNRAIDCIQAEQTIAIRKRKFLNRFSVVNNVLCQVSESHRGALQKTDEPIEMPLGCSRLA